MKKIFLFACLLVSVSAAFAQWPWEKIEGNGHIIKETRNLSGAYTAVSSLGAWDVMIAYGDGNSIQVEGDENLLPYIETSVENGRLNIRSKKNVNLRTKNKITVYVALTKMTGVSLSGSGDIIGKGKFENDGTSDFHVSGSGNIRLSMNKIRKADISVSGSGNIRIEGTALDVTAKVSGSGNIDCGNLISESANAYISGSGNVKFFANKSVDASISGSGSVSYRGTASDIRKHVIGSGKLIKDGE